MMKSTGIVRKVDELGRVVLPIELRRTLGIDEKDALEIYVDQEKLFSKNMSLLVFFVVMPAMFKFSVARMFAANALKPWEKPLQQIPNLKLYN